MKLMARVFILTLVALLAVPVPTWSGPAVSSDVWYKGNLHTHTTFSDGDSPVEKVVAWYRDHGYDFLSITDHNHLTLTEAGRKDSDQPFLLIPGNEISDRFDGTSLHLLALGLRDASLQPTGGNSVVEVLQNNIDAIRKAGAVPVLAHPNFKWAFQHDEMIQLRGCRLFELWNAHPRVNNLGGGGAPSTEEIWDRVLSAKRLIYGIGTDDMHKIATYPGKSWVMVRAAELSENAILAALDAGDFYISTGVELEEIQVDAAIVRYQIKPAGDARFTTHFIAGEGRVVKTDFSMTPSYLISGNEGYLRVKIIDSNGRLAFTQPVVIPAVANRIE